MNQEIVGRIHYAPARAVKVRDENRNPQNAVYGSIALYVDTKTQTDAIIANWERIMEAANAVAEQIIAEAGYG